jgi:RNA polymerase sigma-70 factor (ECF subfamily)
MWKYHETKNMKELLRQYKTSLKDTRKMLSKIKKQISLLEQIYTDTELSKVDRIKAKGKLEPLYMDKKVVSSWVQNLSYCIEWMETGRRPGNRRGAERLAAYQKEIPFENYWIQQKRDKSTIDYYDSISTTDEEPDALSTEEKEYLTNKILSSLTERQKTMLTLSANGYTHSEIAELLSVSKGTVDVTIARAKVKIEDDGWFMP